MDQSRRLSQEFLYVKCKHLFLVNLEHIFLTQIEIKHFIGGGLEGRSPIKVILILIKNGFKNADSKRKHFSINKERIFGPSYSLNLI